MEHENQYDKVLKEISDFIDVDLKDIHESQNLTQEERDNVFSEKISSNNFSDINILVGEYYQKQDIEILSVHKLVDRGIYHALIVYKKTNLSNQEFKIETVNEKSEILKMIEKNKNLSVSKSDEFYHLAVPINQTLNHIIKNSYDEKIIESYTLQFENLIKKVSYNRAKGSYKYRRNMVMKFFPLEISIFELEGDKFYIQNDMFPFYLYDHNLGMNKIKNLLKDSKHICYRIVECYETHPEKYLLIYTYPTNISELSEILDQLNTIYESMYSYSVSNLNTFKNLPYLLQIK